MTTVIEMIRVHFAGDSLDEMPDSTAVPVRRKKSAAKTDRQTDRQTEQAARHQPARSRPDDEKGSAILAMLKKHGGTMKPCDLATALKLTPARLRYQLKRLEQSRQVRCTGVTMSRRVSLPGVVPKEEP